MVFKCISNIQYSSKQLFALHGTQTMEELIIHGLTLSRIILSNGQTYFKHLVLIFRLKSNTLLRNLKTTQYYENSLKNSENSFLRKFGYCWNQDNKFDLWFFRLFDNPLSNLPFQVYGVFGLSGPNPRPPYEVKASGLQLIFNVLR